MDSLVHHFLLSLQVEMMNDFLKPNGVKHILMYYQEQEIDREGLSYYEPYYT